MNRTPSYPIKNPIKEGYRGVKPKKVDGADMGPYKVEKPQDLIRNRTPSYGFSKSKSLKFTTEYSNNKRHVPSSCHY